MADTKISALPLATATADAQEIEVNDAGTSKKVKLQDILEHGYVRGGTTAAANLILDSTSHATKGKTLFGASGAYDEANGRLGVGTQSPTLLGEFKGTPSLTSVAVRIEADPTAPAVGDQALINLSAQNSSNAVVNYGVIAGRVETVTAGSEDGRLLFLVEVNSVSTQLMELRGSTKTVELASGVALKVGGLQFLGYTSSATAPTTTQYPNNLDCGFHEDTTGPTFYVAINDGGIIRKVALA